MSPSLPDQPRATHYAPPAVYELRRAGILDEMKADPECFLLKKMCWRKLDGTYLAGFNSEDLGDYEDRTTILFLNKIVTILAEHIGKYESTKISCGKKVLPGAEEQDGKAWIRVEDVETGVIERLGADYIVGCDGAGSQVRRSLFGAREFPGYTWDKQLVATNVRRPTTREINNSVTRELIRFCWP